MTSFVGRRIELSQVRRALSGSRLVSLTGVGGVGKTRLALRLSWDVRRAFPDGVCLVELAGLEDEGLVPQSVITALGIHDQATRWTPETVAERVGDRRLLLVLDNCEHVLETCAATVATLLERCPQLRVLTTTRQALGIAGEQVLRVPALSYPPGDAELQPSGFMGYEAVALFVDRAGAVVPDFALDDRTASAVCAICRRLDGIPLAVELAAFSLRVLSPDQLVQRLDDRFSLLNVGNRDALPRHQTLRALIDWSFDLCSEEERTFWARASVFAEHFDLEGAERVCVADDLDRTVVLDAIAGLVDKSILIRDERDGRVRFRMLETIRQYGLDVLRGSGHERQVRCRHRDWYRGLVEQMQLDWFGPDQTAWFARMRVEHTNIRTALEFCLREPGEASAGVRIADNLRDYWRVSGLISEGRRWCDRFLEGDSGASVRRLRLLISASHLALLQSDLWAAVEPLDEARSLAFDLRDEFCDLLLHVPEAVAEALQEEFPQAITTLEERIDGLRRSGDLPWFSTALVVLGVSCSLLGDHERTTTYYNELLDLCRVHGEKWRRSYALWGLGVDAWRQGDTLHATELVRESLEIQRHFNDYLGAGQCVEALAWIATSERRWQQAARLFGLASTIRYETGGRLLYFFSGYHAECERKAHEELGDGAYARLFEQGANVGLEGAIGYVLGERSVKHRPKKYDATPLSRREREVADLVAQGMSNKQIANGLMISQRTAEAHVEHILVKLGFMSRAEIAAWVTEQRSDDTP
ncbi:ATP-binding protein [Saccharopolyspora spinosa]|uniref:ATP-binding protein n=1 Tax=Saccharopolyspora spinosa TaxID=60894 RepID=UPI00376ED381